MMPASAPEESARLDVRLVEGFRFECRPDCGLCCFASPALSAGEEAGLLAIAPAFRPSGDPPGYIASRPDGGACTFLRQQRCTVHSARPGPCAEFPLSAHLVDRIQVSVVLSCPGVSLATLGTVAEGAPWPATTMDPSLLAEMSAVSRAAGRISEPERSRAAQAWRRALGSPRSGDPAPRAVIDAMTSELRSALPMPVADDLAAVPIPEESEGLERLPLFFDPRFGRVAICAGGEGVDLLTLREGGGVEERLASFAYPDHLPRLTREGDRMLRAYLGYVLERDAFIGAALEHYDARDEYTLLEVCTEDLREIAAATLSRSVYRTWLDGGSAETIDASEIERGIRATDADYLDRPTVGRWL
jgi:putative zinc- or iron-chelating protein